jgi:hypothetical protein
MKEDPEKTLDYADPQTPVTPVEPPVPPRLDTPGFNVGLVGVFFALMLFLFFIAKLGCIGKLG